MIKLCFLSVRSLYCDCCFVMWQCYLIKNNTNKEVMENQEKCCHWFEFQGNYHRLQTIPLGKGFLCSRVIFLRMTFFDFLCCTNLHVIAIWITHTFLQRVTKNLNERKYLPLGESNWYYFLQCHCKPSTQYILEI